MKKCKYLGRWLEYITTKYTYEKEKKHILKASYFMYVDHPGGLRYVWGSNVSREKGIDREKPPLLPSLFLPEGFFLQPHYYCLAMAKQAALVHISYQPFLPFGYVVVI